MFSSSCCVYILSFIYVFTTIPMNPISRREPTSSTMPCQQHTDPSSPFCFVRCGTVCVPWRERVREKQISNQTVCLFVFVSVFCMIHTHTYTIGIRIAIGNRHLLGFSLILGIATSGSKSSYSFFLHFMLTVVIMYNNNNNKSSRHANTRCA